MTLYQSVCTVVTQTKTQTYVDIHLEPQGHIFIFITMYCSFYVNFFKGVVSKEILSWWCVVIMACPFVVVCLFVCLL